MIQVDLFPHFQGKVSLGPRRSHPPPGNEAWPWSIKGLPKPCGIGIAVAFGLTSQVVPSTDRTV